MELVFFKEPHSFIEKAICLKTHSPYYHVEIRFEDGWSWSSRAGQKPAVSFERYPLPENIVTVKINCSALDELKVRHWCRSQVGKSYDYLGILGFVVPFGEHDDNDLFCSEGCSKALQQIGFFKSRKSYLISPGKLFKLINALNR